MAWPFAATVLVLVLLGYASLHVMRGVRAYVTAESLWSNAQKNAVNYLEQYAQTRNEDYLAQYHAEIAVPLGDRTARLALDHPRPDLERARAGLRQGRNHPDDVASMIDLFRWFRGVPFMARAVDLWVQADAQLAELDAAARDLQRSIAAGVRDPADLAPALTRIRMEDRALTRTMRAFADTFDTAARRLEVTLGVLDGSLALLLLAFTVLHMRRLIRQGEAAEHALHAATERAQVTLASIADAVMTVGVDGRIEFLNAAAERLTAWSDAEARGAPLSTVFAVHDEATGNALPNPVSVALRDGVPVGAEGNAVLVPRDGEPIAIDYSAAPIRDRQGGQVGAVLVFQDMSRERQYASRLAHLASHDALTALPNRREFERRVAQVLGDGPRLRGSHSLLYLDLDEFKLVNDTCGHAAGDELLRQVSALLKPRLREGDTLARLGGDEFGVLLAHCPPSSAMRIAESLRKTIADFHFVWKQRPFKVGVSIGVVDLAGVAPTLAQVLSAADAACYMAKDKGRNRVQAFSAGSGELIARRGEMEWASRLHAALEQDRFCLFAQPVHAVRGASAQPAYTELLLRLTDEEGTVVPPMSFIPAAERYHLMPAVDRWVVATALARIAEYVAAGQLARLGTCAINVSGASLSDDDFLDFVQAQFVQHRVPHSAVCFEVTETSAVTSLAKAVAFMSALRGCGCRFALDDFGVGVSSFTYLKHLPVDYLKIDGSFVKDLLHDPVDHAMVEAINRIGHLMGKQTIAESVEGEDTLTALRVIGVDYAQGYGIALPEPFVAPPRLRLVAAQGLRA
jgi:diguanylate cyclase (GGDEF)-like protein/PAS domain S-box-containing protein